MTFEKGETLIVESGRNIEFWLEDDSASLIVEPPIYVVACHNVDSTIDNVALVKINKKGKEWFRYICISNLKLMNKQITQIQNKYNI